MLSAVFVIVGAVGAWLLVDRLLSLRDERLRQGRPAWSEFGPNRTFHSTGWEETIPPLEAADPVIERLNSRARDRVVA